MPSVAISYTACGLAALALFAYCYLPTALSFDARWNTRHEAYSHGYLLLVLCILLALRQVLAIRNTAKSPFWPAIIPLMALSLLWLFGAVTHILVLQQLALPALALLLVTAGYGLEAGKRLRFPFLLFYAAVPVWDVFNNPLQQLTVKVCTWGLELAGIPAFIEETQITIPTGTFQVAGGCSGLNYLLMIGTIAAVYAHLYYRRFWHKILLLAWAALFGLLCNWIRVYSLVIVGHTSDMQSALLGDHEVLGWIAFTVCLVPFFYVASHIESIDRILPPLPVRAEEPALPATQWFVVFGFATFAAISGPAWYKAVKIYPIEGELTASVRDIQSTLVKYPRQPAWQPAFRNVDERLVLQYVGESASIQVHIVSYFSQDQGKELIQWGNQLADGDRWKLTARKIIDGPYQYPLNLAKMKSNTRRAEVIYWYAVGKYFTNSALRAKWYQFLSYLQGREDASLLAIYYLCPSDDCTETRQRALDAAPGVTRLYAQAINELLAMEHSER